MHSLSSLLFLLPLLPSSLALPSRRAPAPFSIPLKQYVDTSALPGDLIKSDRQRLEALYSKGTGKRQTDAPVGNAVVTYLADIGVGDPATSYQLIVDTGSSNTWVGADPTKPYAVSSTTVVTGQAVAVRYGSGQFSGTEFNDTVTLASGLTITGQGVGGALESQGFGGVDGILGVGPERLTRGTETPCRTCEIPTVIQTAYAEGAIPAQVLGVFYQPTTTPDTVENGVLTFGGTDPTYYTGDISYTPVTSVSPATFYWGIDVTSLTDTNGNSYSSGTESGIVDTGTTLVYLPETWFTNYFNSIPNAEIDPDSGFVRFPTASLPSVPDLIFTVGGGSSFEYNKYAQLVEQGLYEAFGFDPAFYYSWINDAGSDNTGLDFIIGMKFLERYYSVYDTDNNRVGFATTVNSDPTTVP